MTPPPDIATARERLLEILSRPEFRQAPPARASFTEMLERPLAGLLEWFGQTFFGGIPFDELPDGHRALFWMPAAVVAAVAAVVAVRSARRLLRGPATARLGPPPGRAALPDDPATHLAEAHRLAAAGAHREALRALFRAVLLSLDRAGLIRYRPPATNREYVRELHARSPDLSALLGGLADRYELAWYGGRPAGEADWASGLELATRLLEAAGREAVPKGAVGRARPA